MGTRFLAGCLVALPFCASAAPIGDYEIYEYADWADSSPIDKFYLNAPWVEVPSAAAPAGTRGVRIYINYTVSPVFFYYYEDLGFGNGNFNFQGTFNSFLKLGSRKIASGAPVRFDLSGSVSEDEPEAEVGDIFDIEYSHLLTRRQVDKFLSGTSLDVWEYNLIKGAKSNNFKDGSYELFLEWQIYVYAEFLDDPAPPDPLPVSTAGLFGLAFCALAVRSRRRGAARI